MTEIQRDVQLAPEKFAFSGRGTIYSYTTVLEAPEGYEEQAPYLVALVQLDEGVFITAQLTDVDSPVNIGDRVEMVTRKLTTEGERGMIVYGYKFRPVLGT
jgi:uncharacterized OB-fold protein